MKRFRAMIALLGLMCAAAMSPAFGAGSIEYVTVQAYGEGNTAAHATASALAAAVAQVNGAELASTQLTAELTQTLDTGAESAVVSASQMGEAISQQTRGLVRDYQVLSRNQDGSIWVVQVEARIARHARSVQADRLRMSVLPFRESRKGQSPTGENFASELSSHLTQSRKFAVLDRQFEAERQLEMDINASPDAPMEELAKLGNRLGTDYMVVGIIEEASVSTRKTELAGRTITSHSTRLALSYRVIDAPTGQVKFADNWARATEGSALPQLVSQAAEAIGRQISDAIFPIAVESVAGDTLFLGQGGKSIKVGQRYRLLRYGQAITDSYTGESLGRQETEVGLVEITEVQSKIAKAKILKSNVDVAANFAPLTYIVRLQKDASGGSARQQGAAPPAEKPARRAPPLKSKLESDW